MRNWTNSAGETIFHSEISSYSFHSFLYCGIWLKKRTYCQIYGPPPWILGLLLVEAILAGGGVGITRSGLAGLGLIGLVIVGGGRLATGGEGRTGIDGGSRAGGRTGTATGGRTGTRAGGRIFTTGGGSRGGAGVDGGRNPVVGGRYCLFSDGIIFGERKVTPTFVASPT